MTSDERTFIFSLIFGFFLIFAGALKRKIKDDIPLKETYLMLWREGVVGGFKEFRKNFIPVTKKIIGEIRGYIKENQDAIWESIKGILSSIVKFFHPDSELVKLNYCTIFLYFSLQRTAKGYADHLSSIEIYSAYLEQPPHIDVSFYTKGAITEENEAEIVWALKAKFKEYMRIFNGFDCPCFAVPNVLDNYISVILYYWVLPEDHPAFNTRRHQIMQMRSTSRPINEADTYDRDF